jgi:hypothetical protein
LATKPVAITPQSVEVMAIMPTAPPLQSAEELTMLSMDGRTGLQAAYSRHNDGKARKWTTSHFSKKDKIEI